MRVSKVSVEHLRVWCSKYNVWPKRVEGNGLLAVFVWRRWSDGGVDENAASSTRT